MITSIPHTARWTKSNLPEIALFSSITLPFCIVYDLSIWGLCGLIPETNLLPSSKLCLAIQHQACQSPILRHGWYLVRKEKSSVPVIAFSGKISCNFIKPEENVSENSLLTYFEQRYLKIWQNLCQPDVCSRWNHGTFVNNLNSWRIDFLKIFQGIIIANYN